MAGSKKSKAKRVQVWIQSQVTGHRAVTIRDRLADKVEEFRFDPYVQTEVLYKEVKKIKSLY